MASRLLDRLRRSFFRDGDACKDEDAVEDFPESSELEDDTECVSERLGGTLCFDGPGGETEEAGGRARGPTATRTSWGRLWTRDSSAQVTPRLRHLQELHHVHEPYSTVSRLSTLPTNCNSTTVLYHVQQLSLPPRWHAHFLIPVRLQTRVQSACPRPAPPS